MERYRDISASSGVVAYEIGPDFIDVKFRNGGTYRYDSTKPGDIHLARMKEHAIAGKGLGTYISQHVRGNYARKLP
ncbi:MAG: hypothetical protein JWM95_4974 [Gemmatimonadetes bacterium]|nr:hypothetical protein [Gemmatimonadota bacterium]